MTTGLPFFPQTLSANMVVGRLASGAGPAEQIPVTALAAALSAALAPSTSIQAASISALRALAPPSSLITVLVQGYYTPGDGGHGIFWWNSADATTDNGWSVIAPNAGGTGRWNLMYAGAINARQAGLKCDAATSDVTALQNLFSTWPTAGLTLYFNGIPYIDSPITANVPGSFVFLGRAGTTDGSVLPASYFKKAVNCRGTCVTLSDSAVGGFVWSGGGVVGTQLTITLTRSGTTATATSTTAHGWQTGDSIRMSGAVQTEYNLKATITVTGTKTFTYTVANTAATPATGSPVARHASAGLVVNDYAPVVRNAFVSQCGGYGIQIGDPTAATINCDLWQLDHCVTVSNGDHGVYADSNTSGLPEVNLGACIQCISNSNLGNGYAIFASSGVSLYHCDGEGNAVYGVRLGGGGSGTCRNASVIGGDYESNTAGQIKIDANSLYAGLINVDPAFTVVDGGVSTLYTGGGIVTTAGASASKAGIFQAKTSNSVSCTLANTWYDIPGTTGLYGLLAFRDDTSGNNALFNCDSGGAVTAISNNIANFGVRYGGSGQLQVEVTGGTVPRIIRFAILQVGP